MFKQRGKSLLPSIHSCKGKWKLVDQNEIDGWMEVRICKKCKRVSVRTPRA